LGHEQLPEPRKITEHHWPEGTVPLAGICCITYNHEKFIAQCIEGFLMQETTFPVEIIIHDDASTDGTVEIIRAYQTKYPRLIRSILQKENQNSKGKLVFPISFEACRAEYVAMCEGDDYWTDPQKLAKQAAFLDTQPECVSCFHNAIMFSDDQSNASPDSSLNKRGNRLMCRPGMKTRFSQKDFFKGNVIPTCSVMFRREAVGNLPPWFKKLSIGDLPLHILCTEHGMAGYLQDVMAAYRLHPGGFWSSKSSWDKIPHEIKMFEELERYLQSRPQRAAIQASRRQAVLAISRSRSKLELARARQWLDSSPEKVPDAIWHAWRLYPRRPKWLLRWLLSVWPRVLGGKYTSAYVHGKLRKKF
jgi:glycosyltransferase involved in cell wall biosynthesis